MLEENCTCIDYMYGGNVGNEHGGIAPPSSEKGDGEMSEVNPRDFDVALVNSAWRVPNVKDSGNGNGYVMPGDIKRVIGSGGSLGIPAEREPWVGAPMHHTAYVVKSRAQERYAKTKEKALQFASEVLDCDGKVEIKRIELS